MQDSLFGSKRREKEESRVSDARQDIKRRNHEEMWKKDPLIEMNKRIDWEIFAPFLQKLVTKKPKSNAGRKPFDRMLLFKMLILQRIYNLSDDQIEYQVYDRYSFLQFLGLDQTDKVPDAKTIWQFKEGLRESGGIEALFNRFLEVLEKLGVVLQSGQIIDATFVSVPKQRNTREENDQIKKGEVPIEWQKKPHKLAQKDVDAQWTKKGDETHYGFKDHTNIDKCTKLITMHYTTSAEVADTNVFDEVLRPHGEGGKVVHADSAYRSAQREEDLEKRGYISEIHERGARKHPLTEDQKKDNTRKSKKRSRVEHVFASMENELGGIRIRTIGMRRARFQITLLNLTYNIKRALSIFKTSGFWFDRISLSN